MDVIILLITIFLITNSLINMKNSNEFFYKMTKNILSSFIDYFNSKCETVDIDEINFRLYICSRISLISKIFTNIEEYNTINSATLFNDFYKFKMLSVIINTWPNLNVTFGLDIRNKEFKDLLMTDEELYNDVYLSLQLLKQRQFNRQIFEELNLLGLNIDQNIIDLLCSNNLVDRVINERFNCDTSNNEVVISMYKGYDCTLEKNRVYIEVTGPWYRTTWLETTMMQIVYQCLLKHKLATINKSYEQWLYEALFRCYKSIQFSNEKDINCALFSGRRSGGVYFLVLQNMMMNDLYESEKYIGSSSVDSWFILKDIIHNIKNPVGTHAHELSMVFSAMLSNYDNNLVLSQLISHYAYYFYAANKSKIPMLPDTLGTEAYMEAATKIKINNTPFFDLIISSARQDSGDVNKFINILYKYDRNNIPVMASEIDNKQTLESVSQIQEYKSFGAGGFFGDSEKVHDKSDNISMAVKVIRVYKENEIYYPIKLGDGSGKVTLDTSLDKEIYNNLIQKAISLKNIQNREYNLEEEQDKFNIILNTLFIK